MSESEWKTRITKVEPDKIQIRGYKVEDLIENLSFADAIYLVITGEAPDLKKSKLLNAILVSSIDHGVTPPSVFASLTSVSTGAPFNSALASGILSINQYHGGAIENCMRILEEAIGFSAQSGDLMNGAQSLVKKYQQQKKRIAGFGHRIHKEDPRTKKLFEIANEVGVFGQYMKMALEIEKAIQNIIGKNLPLNVDGTIAAILMELKIPKELGNMFFVIARVPGLISHIYEEKTRQKPMRKIIPDDYEYDGDEDLKL